MTIVKALLQMKLLLLWEIVIVMINWNDYRPNWTPLSPVTIMN